MKHDIPIEQQLLLFAGSKLTDEQIDTLDLPNLVPRACGVDIRPNTLVQINEDVGIINGDDIAGFETCYDDEQDGEEKEFVAELVNVNHGQESRLFTGSLSTFHVIIILLLIIGFVGFLALNIMKNREYQMVNDYIKDVGHHTINTEITPLL